ncbi:MAG: L-iditol 2-dehydrogenase [Bauldia sp.]|nr:L-iditol 2-dehydrogenase [Bauldia sp.]
MRLENKIAVVTGGARGIGRAISERYAHEGAKVVIADLLIDEAKAAAAAIGHGATAVAVDVSRLASIQELGRAVADGVGAPDILVNGAAIFGMAPLAEITEEHFDRQFDINVRGLLFTTQVFAAQMIAAGKKGKVINFASQAGRRGEAHVAVYCATKAAVISITQSCALELIRYGINVNAIAPGVVDTPMWDQVDALFAKYEKRAIGEKKRLVGEAVPFGRMGTPEDMTGAAVFLASSDADYILAQTLNVDGGNWMS